MSQDTISLEVQPREITGKAVKRLRRQGIVPAVIHDHGKPSVVVMGNYLQMVKTYQKAGKHHPVELSSAGKKYTTIIKSATFEPRKQALTHLVFNAVNKNEKIEAEVPVHVRYDEGNDASPAERAGLLVLNHTDSVLVEAIASNLPDFVEYDGEKLVAVGDSVTAADLIVPSEAELKIDLTTSIASVYEPSAIAAANDAVGGDEATADVEVPAVNGSPADDDQTSQAAEDQPGGRKQFEGHDDKTNNK